MLPSHVPLPEDYATPVPAVDYPSGRKLWLCFKPNSPYNLTSCGEGDPMGKTSSLTSPPTDWYFGSFCPSKGEDP